MLELVAFILAVIFWIWIGRLVRFGVATATRIAIASEVSAANLATLVEATGRTPVMIPSLMPTPHAPPAARPLPTPAKSDSSIAGWIVLMVFVVAALIVGTMVWVRPAAAADRPVITPQCWEENRGDHVERHCAVNGNDPAVRAPPVNHDVSHETPPPSQAPTAAADAPLPPGYDGAPYGPPRYAGPPPRGYAGPAPRACYTAWGWQPCGLPPAYGPPGYGPPPYYGPPGIVIGFGPFVFRIGP